MYEQDTNNGPKKVTRLGRLPDSSAVHNIGLLTGGLLSLVALTWLLDSSYVADYVRIRQDDLTRDISNSTWMLMLFVGLGFWWYSQVVRSDTGLSSLMRRVRRLAPIALLFMLIGNRWAEIRMMISSDIGREAASATAWIALAPVTVFVAILWFKYRD